jgi:RNA methyltransferase, TrmH family
MITSLDNEKLKTIRKLQQKRWRERFGLFVAEGEDLVDAAAAAGWEPEFVLRAGVDVESRLLGEVSGLGSGTRVVGVYAQRWVEPATSAARLSVYLHGVRDPGNVGTVIRSAHALADGPVLLGPDCADPYSPKGVRASMGSVFARPPARAELASPSGTLVALDGGAERTLADAAADLPDAGVVLCVGAERKGLPSDLLQRADVVARIPLRPDAPDSLNAAMAATVALYEVANRMRPDA